MKPLVAAFLLTLLPWISRAQGWQAEVFTGVAGYTGDLNESAVQLRSLRPAININLKYDLGYQFYFRTGIAWGMVGADDRFNKEWSLVNRNLNFKTHIFEANLGLEYALLPPELFDISYPYIFAGVGVFHFDPYTRDDNHNKVKLHPLSTEGQGLPEYPDRTPYKLFQLCIPMGGGVSFHLNDQFNIAVELSFRKLFTDYLDDVSTTYVDAAILESHKGPQAPALAYRGTFPYPSYTPYPPAGTPRGGPGSKDWYYFFGAKLTWALGE